MSCLSFVRCPHVCLSHFGFSSFSLTLFDYLNIDTSWWEHLNRFKNDVHDIIFKVNILYMSVHCSEDFGAKSPKEFYIICLFIENIIISEHCLLKLFQLRAVLGILYVKQYHFLNLSYMFYLRIDTKSDFEFSHLLTVFLLLHVNW